MVTRRELLVGSAVVAAAAPSLAASDPTKKPPKPKSSSSEPPRRVVTLDGVTLPVVERDGVKVMHLVAEEVDHEFCPGLRVKAWGYNGRTCGPTIEVTQGDRVRIYVTNRLPEPTTVHWHGVRVINGMDGVSGLTQKPIRTGDTWRYEFICPDAGTFMYHPHYDEMTQIALGMQGMFIVHPKVDPAPVDHDFAMVLSEWSVPAGASRPNPLAMNDFNVLTINSKSFPATSPLVVEQGSRVRIRYANLSPMDHHPVHMHGHVFQVTATDGGPVPLPARFPETTVLVPVGTTRTIEFVADALGDWPIHCHMTHHTMTQMGHGFPAMIGADLDLMSKKLRALSPTTMVMGEAGMGGMDHMFKMGMKMPANSVPMKGGPGPFDAIEMGGMFTVLKVRTPETMNDPWYAHPPGTLARKASDDELAADGIVVG